MGGTFLGELGAQGHRRTRAEPDAGEFGVRAGEAHYFVPGRAISGLPDRGFRERRRRA
ncbi:hypothetical protein [Kibdelosporangium aridum]|uniref:hypothetical protein n=1 Tax=Kibdelosporangium aridum TaxID=2030 RepID=UPI0035E705C9